MKLQACGIARSGSTLVWQLLSGVFPNQEIPKIHPREFVEDGSFLVVTIRNPFDVAASRYRIRISRGGMDVGNCIGLEAELYEMKEQYELLLPIVKLKNSVLLWYEDFYDNYDIVFGVMESHLGVVVDHQLRESLKRKYSLEENKRRAAGLSSFNSCGKDKIHGDHIGAVIPNSWSDVLPVYFHDYVLGFCSPICKEWGYNETY